MKINYCLVCRNKKLFTYLNLGDQPLANNLSKSQFVKKYPLKIVYCNNCFHNQLTFEVKKEKLFSKYYYLSSQSKTLQNHFDIAAKKYIKLLKLKKNSFIIDIGSNDGIGLKYFKKKKFKNILGIEPAKNIAKIANKNGIKTINSFLNLDISKKYKNKADLVTASNVFAHNKDIIKLAEYLVSLLKKNGVLIIEIQYLISMLKKNLFDNIYHEHIHYWSLNSINYLFKKLDCTIIKVEKVSSHGGSIRCYIKKNKIKQTLKIKKILKSELKFGINNKNIFVKFSNELEKKKTKFKKFLFKNRDKNILGYGAAAKTSTLLNYLKISDDLKFIIDDNELKQNHYIPGTKIKIISRKNVTKNIDFLVVFAWNYFSEIKKKIRYAKNVISIRQFFK